MPDRVFFPLIFVAVLAIVGLALVYPQGDGRRSPGPFGHQTTADAAARVPKLRPATTAAPKKNGLL